MSQDEREFHLMTAKKCFNETWDYLEKMERDQSDEQRMLNLAHASRYHWSFVGDASKLAVGDWQISRVYAALGQHQMALQFAKSSLDICQTNKLSELLISAYEGMARALVAGNNHEAAREYLIKARSQLNQSKVDEEDKKIYLDQIRETEEMLGQ